MKFGWMTTLSVLLVIGCTSNPPTKPDTAKLQTGPRLSPMQRFVQADRDESGGLNREEFAQASPKFSRYFHLIDADADGEASLDELLATWQKYRDKLQSGQEAAVIITASDGGVTP